jgi:succinate-semialdehyde dehydrogenase / glutarate-semialdehyde dehydrogenase
MVHDWPQRLIRPNVADGSWPCKNTLPREVGEKPGPVRSQATNQKGAKVLAGGQRIGNSGYFFPLTVLADVPDDARVMRDEPFGPLALVNPVRSLDEAIEKANSLPYGLAAYAFTRSAQNADRLATEVDVGNLSINHFVASVAETPFGGVKDSGYGREGGTEGLQCYTVTKNVSHKMT